MPEPDTDPDLPRIPFNKTATVGREMEYVQEAITGGHPASGGAFTARACAVLAEAVGAPEVLLTTSCTAALELSAMLLDLEPGDTVIVPSFTFTSTALAFARQGARLVFCDIEPVTLGLDPQHLATLLDDSVRAVVVVHYAGVACDVAGVRRVLADRPDVTVVEDNAHGLFGSWRGEPLGSLGRFSAQSFHETKNFVCGEGGVQPADGRVVGEQVREEHDVRGRRERGEPRLERLRVATALEVGERRDRRAGRVPGGRPGQRLAQRGLQRPGLEAVVGAEPPVRDRPLHRVAQQGHDLRLAQHPRRPGSSRRVVEVAGALLAEQQLAGGVREEGLAVPPRAADHDVVGQEHLGLRPGGARHGDLGVRVEQGVQVGRAAALGADDEQVPAHRSLIGTPARRRGSSRWHSPR